VLQGSPSEKEGAEFNLFSRWKARDDPFAHFSGLNDEEWLDVLVRSINEPVIDGFRMPRFPDEKLQIKTVGYAGEPALQEAFRFFSVVKKYSTVLERPLDGNTHVLDFGCAWGRILRLFLKDCRAAHVRGIDVDPALLKLARAAFPYCRFDRVKPMPPTKFSDNSFDVIVGFSVFSHLSERASLAWVHEFTRILRPKGFFVMTTQLRDFVEFCRSFRGKKNDRGWHNRLADLFVDTDATYAAYDAGEYLHAPTGGGAARSADFYGETMIPEAYVRRRWTDHLRLVDFIADRNVLPQAVIVMQKP
jgi:SAM-dependent methyltransferase